MASAVRNILVVGGNGFLGSAVCKAALARGIKVTSVSSSGTPYQTAKGHSPAWTTDVDWQKGDALHPQSFSHLFPKVDGVVHTLGLILESATYKKAVREGDVLALFGSVFQSAFSLGDAGNPLKRGEGVSGENRLTYESMNRDSALRVCKAFITSPAVESRTNNDYARPFVYVSAEDIFRPVIPARYIETKREAERGIEEMIEQTGSRYRGVYIRPSLIYHAHHRPLTTPAAALLDLSASIHSKVPPGIPTPSSVLRSLGSVARSAVADATGGTAQQLTKFESSILESIANALVIPPIHVDLVAQAICATLDSRSSVRGVVDVRRMRELIGRKDAGPSAATGPMKSLL